MHSDDGLKARILLTRKVLPFLARGGVSFFHMNLKTLKDGQSESFF